MVPPRRNQMNQQRKEFRARLPMIRPANGNCTVAINMHLANGLLLDSGLRSPSATTNDCIYTFHLSFIGPDIKTLSIQSSRKSCCLFYLHGEGRSWLFVGTCCWYPVQPDGSHTRGSRMYRSAPGLATVGIKLRRALFWTVRRRRSSLGTHQNVCPNPRSQL